MQSIVTVCVAGVLLLMGRAWADTKAEIVSTATIWDRAPRNTDPDLTRVGDRWFLVCQESTGAYSQDGAIRVLTSADGATWEAVARIPSPTPTRGLSDPRITRTPDGRLMISALGILPYLDAEEPLPKYGGLIRTMAWYSRDGRAWGERKLIGPEHFPFGRVVWHDNVAYSYAVGCICGIAQTVQVFGSKDGTAFECRYRDIFSDFLPGDAALAFEGDAAYCLMSRAGATVAGGKTGLLGTAKPPYGVWEWKEMDRRIDRPNVIRLPDGRFIAAVGLSEPKVHTALCEFHPRTGQLTELLELPTGGEAVAAGLAWHDGHLWVSYHAERGGKLAVHLAKVKLK